MCTLRILFLGASEADEYELPHEVVYEAELSILSGCTFQPGVLALDLWRSWRQPPVWVNQAAIAAINVERCPVYIETLADKDETKASGEAS